VPERSVSSTHPLQIGVADLLAQPGTRRTSRGAAVLDGLATSAARVPDGEEIGFEVTLEAIGGGAVTASGTVSAPWSGTCRRCLEPVEGIAEVEVREVFEPHPTEGETYPLRGEQIDLEPMVRDAVLLALPLAPLCRDDCRGPSPDQYPTGSQTDEAAPIDPRWAALSQLEFDE
jgi:uncharacterized protein